MAEVTVKGVKVKIDENDPTELRKPVDLKLVTSTTSRVLWDYQFFPIEEGKRWSDINSTYYGCGVIVKFKFKEKWYEHTCGVDHPNRASEFKCKPQLPEDINDSNSSKISEACIYRRTPVCSPRHWN